MSKDDCMGFHLGPVYVEHCMSGDTNIGVEAGAYGGVGYEVGAGAYCELTYNSHDGLSTGCGTSVSAGYGAETPAFGVYANETYSTDTRDK